jgi:hypothetical protein
MRPIAGTITPRRHDDVCITAMADIRAATEAMAAEAQRLSALGPFMHAAAGAVRTTADAAADTEASGHDLPAAEAERQLESDPVRKRQMTPDRFTTLERLPARVADPTPLGALEPTVSGGALMLRGDGAEGTEFPFGANVASLLIFDLADDRIVGSVETLMPLDSWEQSGDDLAPPRPSRRGSLQIEGPTIELYVPDAEPRFLVNGDQGRLLIELGDRGPDTEWVTLSDRCHALIGDGHLVGLAVDLA